MSASEIADAFAAGQFRDVLAGREPEPEGFTVADLAAMSDEDLDALQAGRTPQPPTLGGDADQGARGDSASRQVPSREALRGMSADEVVAALRAGRLNRLLGR